MTWLSDICLENRLYALTVCCEIQVVQIYLITYLKIVLYIMCIFNSYLF